MPRQTITFVGGGNMATSLVGGLVADGFPASSIWVCDPEEAKLARLNERYEVHTSASNEAAAGRADTVVLAVKPQVMPAVTRHLAAALAERRPLVVSIAAGVREEAIRRWLGFEASIVRAMPNTPALVRSGATALYANPHVVAEQRSRAESILRAVGVTVWIDDESQMDAVTALSGSGPAYAFLLMEMMELAGREMGLPEDTARLLALETVFGAAKMALESEDAPAVLRERVTSPGGTTERALEILEEGDVRALFVRALDGARQRAGELGRQLGDE